MSALTLSDVSLFSTRNSNNSDVVIKYGVCTGQGTEQNTLNVIIDGDTQATTNVKATCTADNGDRVIMLLSKRLLTVIGSFAGGFNIDMVYPIGSIYMNAEGQDPNALFKGTRWARIGKGRTLIDAGEGLALKSTGGKSSISLSERELPSHSHSASADYNGIHSHDVGCDYDGGGGGRAATVHKAGYPTSQYGIETRPAGSHKHNITVNSTGDGRSFSIQNPYLAVAIWQRTA